MKLKFKKKSNELLLSILGCDQKMLELIMYLFERFETEYKKCILPKVVETLPEIEEKCHFENFILGILVEVLNEINNKYDLDFDCSCIENTEFSYEFALSYLEETLNEMWFEPSEIKQIISEFSSWKVVLNQKSFFYSFPLREMLN